MAELKNIYREIQEAYERGRKESADEIEQLREIIDWRNELLRGWLSAVGHYKILPKWILGGTKKILLQRRQSG